MSALAHVALTGAADTSSAIRQAAQSIGQATRTHLAGVASCETALGTTIEFTIENIGQANLGNFAEWDLIAVYQSDGDYEVEHPGYTPESPPGAGQWTVSGIQMASGAAEVIERGILNPGERAVFAAELPASAWADGVNKLSLSTDRGKTVDVAFDGTNDCAFYLHDNPSPPAGTSTSQADLPLDNTYPSQPTLYDYDSDRDSQAGLVILRGGSGAGESDLAKYQNWRTAALSDDLVLAGTVTVDLWAAMKDFDTSATGSLTVFLRDYDGASYTEIASTTVTASPWDAGATGAFVKKSVDIANVNYTVAAGNRLEVKVIVASAADDDMWFAYDTVSYPARVTWPGQLRLTLESTQQKLSTSTYYSLQIDDGADDTSTWWYLHNNPTPPEGDTLSQADLPLDQTAPTAATLYNYDLDEDGQPGRVVAEGGSGEGEADLTLYQNWRTGALSEELSLAGDVSVVLWSAVQNFDTSAAGEIIVYLRDYDGASYSEIASSTLSVDPWDIGATGTWVERTVPLESVNYLVPAGNRLEVKVIVKPGSDGSMWFAYDTSSYQSRIEIPGASLPDVATLTVDAGSQSGRFRPSGNDGRFLYPLKGYTGISDSDWTVTYEVRRPDGDGFTWLSSAVDITPGTQGEWVDIDLSSAVPERTTGAVVELVNTHNASGFSAAVRGKGDTRDYVALYDETLEGLNHRWQIVKVGSDRLIQGYNGNTSNIVFKLVGYTYGNDPVYQTIPPDVTPAVLLGWTDVDVSAFVSDDADGVILLVDNGTNASQYGVREKGSTDSDTTHELSADGNTMYVVGIDQNDVFQVFVEPLVLDMHFFLIGETRGSVVYYDDDIAVADPTIGSWQQIDADDYAIPAAANGLIFQAQNSTIQRREMGFRHGDSTDDWNKYIWASGRFQGAAGLNDANIWDEYMGNSAIDVFISAYTIGTPKQDADIHADIDVLVRRRTNGEIRAVLATDVATTSDIIAGEGWKAYTGTFTPTPYTVVDQTDFLEIDLYGHITRNDGTYAVLEFRISDISPPRTYRTAIDNVALVRE